MARFNFLSEAQISYDRSESDSLKKTGSGENVIVLSDEFYREINTHRIPTDLDAVKVLMNAPAALDLFMWLSYRCYTCRGDERIPLFGPGGLTAQLGSVEYSRGRRFRAKLDQWLQSIRTIWPECPAQITADGLFLRIIKAEAVISEGR